jgi:hypothetical protein
LLDRAFDLVAELSFDVTRNETTGGHEDEAVLSSFMNEGSDPAVEGGRSEFTGDRLANRIGTLPSSLVDLDDVRW